MNEFCVGDEVRVIDYPYNDPDEYIVVIGRTGTVQEVNYPGEGFAPLYAVLLSQSLYKDEDVFLFEPHELELI